MAIAALTINSQREEVVDFTFPFYYEAASVVIKVRDICVFHTVNRLKAVKIKKISTKTKYFKYSVFCEVNMTVRDILHYISIDFSQIACQF